MLAASPNEDGATIDGILTFGLIWLQHTRDRARRYSVHGLRLFLPRGSSSITAHRMAALASPQEVELYEYEPLYWRVRRIARSNAGNLATWIVPRREIEQAIAAAMPLAERIRRLAPDAIRVGVAAGYAGSDAALSRPGVCALAAGRDVVRPWRPPGCLDARKNGPPSKRWSGSSKRTAIRWLRTPSTASTARSRNAGWKPWSPPTRRGSMRGSIPRHIYAQVPAFSSGRPRNHRFAGGHAGRAAGRSRIESFRRHSTGDAGGRLLAARALPSRSGRLSQVRIFPGGAAEARSRPCCSSWLPDSGSIPPWISYCDTYPRKSKSRGSRWLKIGARCGLAMKCDFPAIT